MDATGAIPVYVFESGYRSRPFDAHATQQDHETAGAGEAKTQSNGNLSGAMVTFSNW